MRFNRIKRNAAKIKIKKNNKILFFIVLPVTAIVFGYALSKFIIIPAYYSNSYYVSSKDNTPTEKSSPAHIEYVHPEKQGIYFQLGSFSTKENAQAFCNDLKTKDIPCIIREEQKFLVLTGGAIEETTINMIEKQLEDKGIEFFAKGIPLSSWSLSFAEKEEREKLEKQIFAIDQWMNQTLDYLWKSERGTQDEEKFLNSLKELRQAVQTTINFNDTDHKWNQFMKDLEKDLTSMEQQSRDIHEIYQSYDKIFQNLIKVYNSFEEVKK